MNNLDFNLEVQESQREIKRKARRRLLNTAITGKDFDTADFAKARGLVFKERENSIFSDSWLIIGLYFLAHWVCH